MGFFDDHALTALQKRVDAWGIVEATEADESADRIILHRMQDCEPILELNKERQAAYDHFQKDSVLGKLAATVPNLVVEQWCQLKGVSYAMMMSREGDALWKRFLNDAENSGFRVWPGRL